MILKAQKRQNTFQNKEYILWIVTRQVLNYKDSRQVLNYKDSRQVVNYKDSRQVVNYKDSRQVLNYKDSRQVLNYKEWITYLCIDVFTVEVYKIRTRE